MRKILRLLIGFFIIIVILFLFTRTFYSYQNKKEMEVSLQTLQHISFESLTGGKVYIDGFNPDKSTVIIYFHPECEHCQYEASEIGKQAQGFYNANVIMISPDDSSERLESFAIRYRLWEVENLTILLDRDNQFKKQFGQSVIPSVFIYGSDKHLRKSYKGETRIDAIIKYIN